MKKHKYNIFPEAKAEDFTRLLDDIRTNGFDQKQAVTLYQGEVLDGWNRTKACQELGIKPPTVIFTGTDAEAIAFVMRTNKRRNLNSGQWACIAADADDLLAVIAAESAKNIGGRPKLARPEPEALESPSKPTQIIAPVSKDDRSTATKAAELFNTNRTYVNQAVKMKTAAPEVFEKVKAGKMTMQDANKAVRAIPTDPWGADEKERKEKVESGQAVVANQQRDKNLIAWAEKNGKAVRVDRGSLFGNPFVLGADGDRDAVCDAYEDHYLPHKPSIMNALHSLKGKVLICHCYPLRCHAQSLIL
jgi:ParB-like chromosome segregation protein Spo0J